MQINGLNCKWTLTHIFFLLFFSDEKLGYYVNCFWRDFLLLKKKISVLGLSLQLKGWKADVWVYRWNEGGKWGGETLGV